LQQIVSWMMAKDPAKRYPTPERAAQALQVFLAAEAAPLANPEAEARMRSFLTWLEMGDESKSATPPKAAPPAPAPAAKPVAPAVALPVAAVAAPPAPSPAPPVARPPKPDKHPPKKPKRQEAPAPAVAAPVATEAASAFDVELLPPTRAAAQTGLAGLSRRDFVFMSVGAGSVLVAIFIGWVVAKLAGH
jgi:hypothetical protein